VVPAWHARAERGGGAGEKRDGAQLFVRGGAEESTGSYMCADACEWSSREQQAPTSVRRCLSIRPDTSKALYVKDF
jgi:hypothetical protein